jgi:hypothetical protein
MVRIQLVSDIIAGKYDIVPIADVLCVAGNLGGPAFPEYVDLLKTLSHSFKYVILVPGNHEYFETAPATMQDVDKYIRSLCRSFDNVYYLPNGENIVINDVNFIGATLWPYIHKSMYNDSQLLCINRYFETLSINDYKPWNIETNNMVHCKQLCKLTNAMRYGNVYNLKNIVVSHYPPLTEVVNTNLIKNPEMFASNLRKLLSYHCLDAWLYGCSYKNMSTYINGVFVASNQMKAEGYNKSFVFEI